ncbi:MAG: glutamate--tRNA ligase [Xanthomonadales bacterium]|jgi:glutamyl-tRNA synthetase|nr:glutamate--tRNA ligase [Xanthomonadales bacterium]
MVRTRFAPSPTGYLHLGGARTALFCWLEARHRGGRFLLRIEDTDRERSTQAAVQAILDGMNWLGLAWDEGPIYQTHRFDRYRAVAEQLLAAGKAYRCWCTPAELDAMREAAMARGEKPRYNGYWRDRTDPPPPGVTPVIRFRTPREGRIVVNDRVRGRVEIDNAELDDLIIWRSDDSPTYNFAVVIDDADTGVTEVIRGDDHLNNTPRQIHLYEALGLPVPSFAHLPMILGPDGAKLSKRHGAVSVMEYRDQGFLPIAMRNYLVRLGWSHGDQEIFSDAEMIALFSADDVNQSASRFDPEKLKWLNHHYLKTLDPAEVAPHLEWHLDAAGLDRSHGPAAADVVVGLRERCATLKDMAQQAAVWFQPLAGYQPDAAKKQLTAAAALPLTRVREQLASLPHWTPAAIHGVVDAVMAELSVGLGKVGGPLRVAITGSQQSPAIEQTVYLAGPTEALKRIDAALAYIARQGS